MTLGQKLKKARLDRGLTQAQVVGDRITRNMLSQLENDLASPSVGTLEYLASVLGVQAAWLLADEKEEEAAGRTGCARATAAATGPAAWSLRRSCSRTTSRRCCSRWPRRSAPCTRWRPSALPPRSSWRGRL